MKTTTINNHILYPIMNAHSSAILVLPLLYMLIGLNNITFEFGARTILEDSSWTIFPKERIGLIGANGTGKSTLLKIIVGEYTVSGGNVERPKSTSIGYFHQDLQSMDTDESILTVASHAYAQAHQIQKELSILEEQLKVDEHNEELLNRYSELLHDFDVAGGYEMEHKSAEILEGLGFTSSDLNRPFKEFSGGWRMRVLLAKMMLQKPDLLLLDEPTNHLDLPSIYWLEGFLQSYPGTVVIVSHDRYFLDRMVTKIVEVAQQKINIYSGNYSFYETEKATRIEFMQREYENQQEFIRQQERFIERFKAKASKASAAQSLIKKLDRLDIIEEPIQKKSQIKINFEVAQQPGKVIIDLKNVSKSYGPIQILRDTSNEIYRKDKIALIGANGKGKSTLLRIIANREEIQGSVTVGHNVHISFYAQHQIESLNVQNEILKELTENTKGYTETELRSLLGCFLFQGDDVYKKISILSGGERARVALAKVITFQSNFLMLDEPTNHLDISSVEMLAQALNDYDGTFIIVSHDRFFIEATANKIWEIEDGKIIEFNGKYSEWLEWKEKKTKNIPQQIAQESKPKEVKKEQSSNKEQSKKLKSVQNKFKKVEETLAELNEKKDKLEQALSDPQVFANKDLFLSTEKEYLSINNQINNVQKEYEELFEELLLLDSQ